ncbi:hypothetical protein [Hymenobacter radiodurans]|uniref:hypothetical protein n=1 Tax=Hymenobacter radiodurans TaxID=2496028 RepID=UPI001058C85A|nr:hypothetical protein [Hymenobacter radiodurans]
MWSNWYKYYEIRSSPTYNSTADTKAIRSVLDSLPELERVGLVNYKNAVGYPWIDLALVKGNNGSFSCSNDTWSDEFNMMSITCSKSEDGKVPDYQVDFLIRLASILNWELIEDENEEDEENIVLWKPH